MVAPKVWRANARHRDMLHWHDIMIMIITKKNTSVAAIPVSCVRWSRRFLTYLATCKLQRPRPALSDELQVTPHDPQDGDTDFRI